MAAMADRVAQKNRILDLLARHNRKDYGFLQAVERCLQRCLEDRYPHAQAFCFPDERTGYRFEVHVPTRAGFRELPAFAWAGEVDTGRLLREIQRIPVREDLDGQLLLCHAVGGKGDDLVLAVEGLDAGKDGKNDGNLALLPKSYLALLDGDRLEALDGEACLASRVPGKTAHHHPVVTRSHSFFLRDLARFCGIEPLGCVISAASGLLVSETRPPDSALRWMAKQANLRALHWAPPPAERDAESAARAAIRIFTGMRLPGKRVRLLQGAEYPSLAVYAPDERARFTLVGPWAGTLRLLSRYVGMSIRILPDEEMPWF